MIGSFSQISKSSGTKRDISKVMKQSIEDCESLPENFSSKNIKKTFLKNDK